MNRVFGLSLAAVLGVPATGVSAQSPIKFSDEVTPFIVTQKPVIALENVRIIDGTGAPAQSGQTLIISGGKIAAVGPSSRIAVPPGAERLDLSGRTVMPGLVMLHEHLMYFSGQRVWHSQPISYPRLFLAAGVTTLRTAGGDFPYVDMNVAKRILLGRIAGPRIFATSPNLNSPDDPFVADDIVSTPAEAVREVDYWSSQGMRWFKAYTGLTPELLGPVVRRAHEKGARVTAHLGATTCAAAANLGIDNIEHSFAACLPELGVTLDDEGKLKGTIDEARAKALIADLIRNKVVLTSTPMAIEELSDEVRALLHPTALANWISGRGRPPQGLSDGEPIVRRLERQFIAAGGQMVIGADAENFGRIAGISNHRALELLAAAGHDPLSVIRMATFDGAKFLNIADRVGSIAVGKQADLIVVDGDPSRRMEDIRRVKYVFRDGVGYDPLKLKASVSGIVGWH